MFINPISFLYCMTGVESLFDAYHALGLPSRVVSTIPFEATRKGIEQKITNPQILQELGIKDDLVEACYHVEIAANLLDSFSETGHEKFLIEADTEYHTFLSLIPRNNRDIMKLITASALSYFHTEQYFAKRIKRGDQITELEAEFYHAERGNDALVYAEIINIENVGRYRGIVSGHRMRQSLWDLGDEILDLDQDKKTLGVNILLMANLDDKKKLRVFANRIYHQTRVLEIPKPLRKAIRTEYERTMSIIN